MSKVGRAAAMVIRDHKILMVQHTVDGRSYFTLPGGGIEDNETPEEAAIRELYEECGVRGRIIRRTSVFSDPYADKQFFTFLVDIGNEEPSLGYDPELSEQIITAVKWCAFDKLSERDRAWLWSAGLVSVAEFVEELDLWSDDVSYPLK